MVSSLPHFRSWLPARFPDSHKNDFGHVLVLGGSRGLMGAPRLAALGALRGGAGLVTIGVPESLEPIAASGPWEAMTLPLPEQSNGLSDRAVSTVRSFLTARRVTCVALGPGLGGRKDIVGFVRKYFASVEVPTVLDADGLNALALFGPVSAEAPLILTPHPGEMARLLKTSTEAVQKNRRAAVREAARRYKGVVVLKGHGTVVSDGDRVYTNATGNPGMATAGMGDVLSGLIAALYAQVAALDMPERLWRSAVLGVALHGLAGDLARKEKGPVSLLSGDVATGLSSAFRHVFPS
jgi:hydroxyethylthiazole kinase-like uncharacterized protein yjeF